MDINKFKEQYDSNFDETTFIAKVNNIVIKFFNSLTLNQLEKVDHFVSDKVYEIGKYIIDSANDNERIRMFDELNIRESKISNIDVNDEYYTIEVSMNILYMDYYISKNTGDVVQGNNNNRTAHSFVMVFKKKINARPQNIVRTCPTCGASLNTNDTGICEYCHTVYDQENHDWYLDELRGNLF